MLDLIGTTKSLYSTTKTAVQRRAVPRIQKKIKQNSRRATHKNRAHAVAVRVQEPRRHLHRAVPNKHKSEAHEPTIIHTQKRSPRAHELTTKFPERVRE